MIRVNVASDMPNTSVIAYFIKRDQHPRNLDPHGARERRIFLLKSAACVKHIPWFGRSSWEGAGHMPLKNRVCDFTELAAVELGGLPSTFSEVPENVLVCSQQLFSKSIRKIGEQIIPQ